ncbi:MAG TPA: Ig-like domain-containing protein [Thermoplasmata archaeon]|nr:Ig-like domain-containing protein [Thermoplasmata archaeon]
MLLGVSILIALPLTDVNAGVEETASGLVQPQLVWTKWEDPATGFASARSVAAGWNNESFAGGGWQTGGIDTSVWRVSKMDESGGLEWDWKMGFGPVESKVMDIAADSVGGVVAVGWDGTNGYQWKAVRLHPNGTVDWEWNETRGNGNDHSSAVTTDGVGNVYIAGETYDGTSTHMRMVKLSPAGQKLWDWEDAVGFGVGTAIAVDDSGNTYVGGTVAKGGNWSWVVTKLGSNGQSEWTWTENPAPGQNEVTSLSFSDGLLIVGGYRSFNDSIGDDGWRVVTLRPDRSVAWTWENNSDDYQNRITGVSMASNGDIVVVGSAAPSSPPGTIWRIVTLSTSGNTSSEWRSDTTWGDSYPHSVEAHPGGGFSVAGESSSGGRSGWQVARFSLGPPAPPELVRVEVSPPSSIVIIGEHIAFSGLAIDQRGKTFTANNYSWNVSGNIGTIDPLGSFRATNPGLGNVAVTATHNAISRTAVAVVNVLDPVRLERVELAPVSASINVGELQVFIPSSFDQHGTPLDNVTYGWSMIGPIGKIDQSGTFTATFAGVGSIRVNATYNSTTRWAIANVTVVASPPLIIATNPTDGTPMVPLDSEVSITWSEAMERASSEASFSTSPVTTCSFTWISSQQMTCGPSGRLLNDTTYCVTLDSSARDLQGEKMLSSHSFCFGTGSSDPLPGVMNTYPPDGETAVDPLDPVRITFSEAMETMITQQAFSATPPIFGLFTWSEGNTVVELVPDAPLQIYTSYQVKIAGFARAKDGGSLGSGFGYSFTTAGGLRGQPYRLLLSQSIITVEQGVPSIIEYQILDAFSTLVEADVTWVPVPSSLVEISKEPGNRLALTGKEAGEGRIILRAMNEFGDATSSVTVVVESRWGIGPPGELSPSSSIGLGIVAAAMIISIAAAILFRHRAHKKISAKNRLVFPQADEENSPGMIVRSPTSSAGEGDGKRRRAAVKAASVKGHLDSIFR